MTIDAAYRVVTPLFSAGADPLDPELRAPSVKGVLRSWWRALAWSRYGGDLDAVRQEEDRLFGSAAGGRSRVSMHLISPSKLDEKKAGVGQVLDVPDTKRVVGEGVRYLGYGVMEAFASSKKNTKAGELTRACLRAPFDFVVRMRGRDLTESDAASLRDALIALGTLGGLGARSRKGYGSTVLQSLRVDGVDRWSAPQTVGALRGVIAGLPRGDDKRALPEFTALSSRTRHVLVSSSKKEPLDLLDLVGRELVRFRSWGRKEKVLGGPSERRFRDDHDLMKRVGQGVRSEKHPRRIAFGLPHNYGKKPREQVGPHDRDLDRRASPLFIHLHVCGGAPVAVLSFLPARFLPEGRSGVSVGGHVVPQRPEDELYRPVHDFLDRLRDPKKRKEPFTETAEVPS